MVALGGMHVWLLWGGMRGCSWGACLVAPEGGMHGCSREHCVVKGGMCGKGGHVWQRRGHAW